MLIGTSLEMVRSMNIEAAEKLDNDDSKIIDMPTYSVISDDAISSELSKLAKAVKDTDGNSKDAKENLEARRVKFFDKYFKTYADNSVECFDTWNIQKRFTKEISGYLGYTEKQIPQMVKFFSPLFSDVRGTMPNSLGMPITTQSEKVWKRSEELALEHDAEIEDVFKNGIMNLSLFCTGGKLKDEDWAEIQASWNIDYWEAPNWKRLTSLKGKSISREVVDQYMVLSEVERQAEAGKLELSVNLKEARIKDEVLANLDVDDWIQIASDIDVDALNENQLKDLKKEMSAILENVTERLSALADTQKRQMLFDKFMELESSGNLEKRLALSDEQLAALEGMGSK